MSAKRRHIPLRSCIVCKSKTVKRELLRIVANPNSGVAFDAGGKLSGRGAYLCLSCAKSSDNIRKGRLEHTLRTEIANDRWKEVVANLKAHVSVSESEISASDNSDRRILEGAYD